MKPLNPPCAAPIAEMSPTLAVAGRGPRRSTRMQRYALDRQAAGDTHREAGRRIGLTRGAMKKRVQRARKNPLTRDEADAQRDRYVRSLGRLGHRPSLSIILNLARGHR